MNALLSTFGIDWRLLLIQGGNFLILIAALSYFLYTPVLKMLKERERVVGQGVEDAQKAGEMLAAADATAAKRIADAEAQAAEAVKLARKEAAEERARTLKEAEARAAQVGKDAEARAVEEATRMRRESEKEIARLALLAAEKVLAKKKV